MTDKQTNPIPENRMLLSEAEKICPIPDKAANEPIFENMPDALKDKKIFMFWTYSYRQDKRNRKYVEVDTKTGIPTITKIPLNPNQWDVRRKQFRYGDATDPEAWTTLDKCIEAWNDPVKRKSVHGIGIAICDGIVGIDEDKLIDPVTGEWNGESKGRADYLKSYTEKSVSDSGIHILLLGAKPSNARSRTNGKNDKSKEIYDTGRFFTWTGHIIEGYPKQLQENQEGINKYYYEIIDTGEGGEKKESKPKAKKDDVLESIEEIKKQDEIRTTIRKIFKTADLSHDSKFNDLYTKGHEVCIKKYNYPSESEVDEALLTKIARTTEEKNIIRAVFKKSSLYRKDRGEAYLERSIDRAIEFNRKKLDEKEETVIDDVDLDFEAGLASMSRPLRYVGGFEVHYIGIIKKTVNPKTDTVKEETVISSLTEIVGVSDNLDIDITDTESNKYTHYKLRTGGITLYPEHGDLLTKGGIQKLIKAGMLATEGQNGNIMEYFVSEIQRARAECEHIKICCKPGWKRNKSIFVSGNFAYSDNGSVEVILTNPITGQIYKKKGTLEGWLKPELIEWMCNNGSRFILYSAFACFIASYLGAQNIVISYTGGTSGGKTLTASIAGSGMGRTDRIDNGETIVRAANITQAAAEYLSVCVNGHYLVFDDTKQEKDYSGLVYMLSNGRKKDRAPNSSLESGETYSASYVITGEHDLLKDSVAQGANGRVIEVKNTIEKSAENAKKAKIIENTILENYGHLTEPFLKKLFEKKESISKQYFELCDRFRDEGKDIGGRIGDQMACICIAGEIIEEIFSEIGIPTKNPYEICGEVVNSNAVSEQKREYWIRGLEIVYNEVSTWTQEKEADGALTQILKCGRGLGGKYTGEWMNILEANVKDICDKHHLNKKELVEKWAEKGITRTDKPEKDGTPRYSKGVNIEGHTKKTISFNLPKVLKVLEIEDDITEKRGKESELGIGIPRLDVEIFKKNVRETSEAWDYLYNNPPEESEVEDFCKMFYEKFPHQKNHVSTTGIMLESAKYFTEREGRRGS